MKYALYNPLSGNGNSKTVAEKFVGGSTDIKLIDMTKNDVGELLASAGEKDQFFLFGGDGTLNRFINKMSDSFSSEVYYFPSGTGNDFSVDVGKDKAAEPFSINEYIKDLPTVTVGGEDHKFINGVGFGIDGYCCEVGDALKEKGKIPNYTGIAIKGLLFKFKPVNAKVTVDGKTSEYKKVWIAPTMFGRHYGGGMIPTPAQDRNADQKEVSVMIFHGSSKLKTLMIFPSIFKGEHVKKTKFVTVMKGKDITVEFDRPTSLQIDGETILGVTRYTVKA